MEKKDKDTGQAKAFKTCPKCRSQVTDNGTVCPHCGFSSNEQHSADTTLLGRRIAGAILIANALLILLEISILPFDEKALGSSPSSIFVSLVIGVLLLRGGKRGLRWAQIAVVIGAVVFPLIHLAAGDTVLVVIQIVFSLSLVGLLFWRPGKIRIGICCTLILGYFALEGVGIYAEVTGKNPIGRIIIEANQPLNSLKGAIVNGREFHYSIVVPEKSGWKRMDRSHMVEQNDAADIWLVNPAYDAHIIVIGEQLGFDADSYAEVVMSMACKNFQGLEIRHHRAVQTNSGIEGRMIDAGGMAEDLAVSYRYGIFAVRGDCYQVICFSSPEVFTKLSGEFDQIIESFSIDRHRR